VAVAETETAGRRGLDADLLREMFRQMMRSRVLDERMWLLNRQGRAPFWISGMGHEAIQVALGLNMRAGHDWLAPYYRDLALTLMLGMTPKDHLLSVLGKAGDPNSGSRQMPAHYGYRPARIISTGSVLATQIPHAAGLALAMKMRGEDAVVVAAIGEGGTSEGDFHEGLNFAATHKLPFVCVVENNGFAISVPWQKQMPTEDVADRAAAYGIPGVKVDGGDAIASYRVSRDAIDRARRGDGPTLIEAKVQRLTSHSTDDDEKRYRSEEDIAETRRHDCLERFRLLLEESQILEHGEAEKIREEMKVEVDVAQEQAEAAPEPDPATVRDHVYASN
jgi:2-oxoisovalerate dehydrogenase E1 component alpha subunit